MTMGLMEEVDCGVKMVDPSLHGYLENVVEVVEIEVCW